MPIRIKSLPVSFLFNNNPRISVSFQLAFPTAKNVRSIDIGRMHFSATVAISSAQSGQTISASPGFLIFSTPEKSFPTATTAASGHQAPLRIGPCNLMDPCATTPNSLWICTCMILNGITTSLLERMETALSIAAHDHDGARSSFGRGSSSVGEHSTRHCRSDGSRSWSHSPARYDTLVTRYSSCATPLIALRRSSGWVILSDEYSFTIKTQLWKRSSRDWHRVRTPYGLRYECILYSKERVGPFGSL